MEGVTGGRQTALSPLRNLNLWVCSPLLVHLKIIWCLNKIFISNIYRYSSHSIGGLSTHSGSVPKNSSHATKVQTSLSEQCWFRKFVCFSRFFISSTPQAYIALVIMIQPFLQVISPPWFFRISCFTLLTFELSQTSAFGETYWITANMIVLCIRSIII